jgi:hypothetical protein
MASYFHHYNKLLQNILCENAVLFCFKEYYGVGGPLDLITNDKPSRLLPYWLQAGHELGYKVSDPNAHQSECN